MAAPIPDFASGESGTLGRRTSVLGAMRDLATDVATAPRRVALARASGGAEPRRVLAVSVARPERAGSAAAAAYELERTRLHDVQVRLAAPQPGAGKWENLNTVLAANPVAPFDWLLIFDDDVILPRGFLDAFVFLCERFELTLAQPAHRHWSHAAWRVTRRRARSVVRRTRFVEIGPVTAVQRRAFDALLPFPDGLRMGWGLDAHWGALAAANGWRVGVVDATPVRHTRPVAGGYDQEAAVREARDFLADRPYLRREEAQQTLETFPALVVRVAVVAEYYPRAAEPELGIWVHRQALAARDAGAEVEVLVLHRPVPSRAALRSRDPKQLIAPLRQPLRTTRDGLRVTYVPFVAPPRPRSYAHWGAYAAPTLRLALRRRDFDLVHAHYAAPAGDAVRRCGVPYVVSVHGGDLLAHGETQAVRDGLGGARLTMANSHGMAERARRLGAEDVRVVHLGTDLPLGPVRHRANTLVTVGHLIARKRHADVLRALWLLRDSHPDVRYTIVGDGPERGRLVRLADSLGLDGRVTFTGALPHPEAVAAAQAGAVFVLPSVDEAYGVAYVEALAGGVPAIGCRREPGPEDLHALTHAMRLVAAADPEGLARTIAHLLDDDHERRRLGADARATVERHLTWEACGKATVAAYAEALSR